MTKQELENNWKRALADYQNLQKRVEEERSEFISYANEGLIRQLLPVVDNLEMMLSHTPDEGLSYIIKEFKQILTNAGVEEIKVEVGQNFDATIMDGLETNDPTSQTVTEVVKPGFKLKNKVLRPAIVKVGTMEEK